MEDDVNVLKIRLNDLVKEFEDALKLKTQYEVQLNSLKESKDSFEANLKHVVLNEKDNEGKKLYSNEEMRKNALVRLCNSSDEHSEFRRKIAKFEELLGDVVIRLEVLKKRFGVGLKEADLLVALMNFKKEMGGKE